MTRAAGAALPAVHYRIAVADARAHRFEVRCTVAQPDPAGQRFVLPTWIPGSYLIREFARHFIDVRAERDGAAVPIVKEAKDRWRVAAGSGAVTVIAEVFAYDLSVRGAYLDASRGFFNGACVFVCPEGFETAACTVDVIRPDDGDAADWRVATTLDRAGGTPAAIAEAHGFGRYRAENYAELIDHPVEMGRFETANFTAGSVGHEIVVSGARRVDLARVARDLARICTWQIELFGGRGARPPFERYLFLVHATNQGHGGLEHRASTSLLCSRSELPALDERAPNDRAPDDRTASDRTPDDRVAALVAGPGDSRWIDDDYLRFLGLASHEYFHAWNVKRIKPAAFVPYDLAQEAYTRQLWIFEGITSYYDDLALVRCGLIDATRYLELVGRSITTLLRRPGREVQPLADASFDAWIKHYRPDAESPNATVSYYLKGSLVALALDLSLRRSGRVSLDDVMRALWQRYGLPGIGVPEHGFRALAEEVARTSLEPFFAAYVDGTAELPLAELFGEFGIDLHLRTASGATDQGGKPASGPTDRCWFGASLDADLALRHVYSGSPAERAGLAPGDVLVALDGRKASADALAALERKRNAGDRVEVHAFRRDELGTHAVELAAAPLTTAWLELQEAPQPAALALRRPWLGG